MENKESDREPKNKPETKKQYLIHLELTDEDLERVKAFLSAGDSPLKGVTIAKVIHFPEADEEEDLDVESLWVDDNPSNDEDMDEDEDPE